GLEWIHSPAPLVHPLDDGTAVVLEQNLDSTKTALAEDGNTWRDLMLPFVDGWQDLAQEILGSPVSIPRHPLLLARFGVHALFPATMIAKRFKNARTRALFAGMAAHSFLRLNEPLSGGVGMLMAIAAHAVGWPIVRGGAQGLSDALCR